MWASTSFSVLLKAIQNTGCLLTGSCVAGCWQLGVTGSLFWGGLSAAGKDAASTLPGFSRPGRTGSM